MKERSGGYRLLLLQTQSCPASLRCKTDATFCNLRASPAVVDGVTFCDVIYSNMAMSIVSPPTSFLPVTPFPGHSRPFLPLPLSWSLPSSPPTPFLPVTSFPGLSLLFLQLSSPGHSLSSHSLPDCDSHPNGIHCSMTYMY